VEAERWDEATISRSDVDRFFFPPRFGAAVVESKTHRTVVDAEGQITAYSASMNCDDVQRDLLWLSDSGA
jgi:hypothetical protein